MMKRKSLVWLCVTLIMFNIINVLGVSANTENEEKSLIASSVFDGKFLMKMDYEGLTAGSVVKVKMYVKDVTMAGIAGFFTYDKEMFSTLEKENIILPDYSSSNGTGDWSARWNADDGKVMITEDSGSQIVFKGTMLFATFDFKLKKDLTQASTITFSTIEMDGNDEYYESQDGISLTLLTKLENIEDAGKAFVTSLFDEKFLMRVDYDSLTAGSDIKVEMYVKDVTLAGIAGFFTYDKEKFNSLEKGNIILPDYSSVNGTGDWSVRWNADNGRVMITEDSGSQIAFKDAMLFVTFGFTLKEDLEDVTTITFSTIEIDGEDEYYENQDGINFVFPLKTNSEKPTPTIEPTPDLDVTPKPSISPIEPSPSAQPTNEPNETPIPSESPIITMTPSAQPTNEPDRSPMPSESPITMMTPSAQPTIVPDETPMPSASPIVTLIPSIQLPINSTGTSAITQNDTLVITSGEELNNASQTVSNVKFLKVKSGKNKITVRWKQVKDIEGYQLEVSTKKNFKNSKKKIVGRNITKYTFKKLKYMKNYYIRVRAFKTFRDIKGKNKKIYGKWSSTKKKL